MGSIKSFKVEKLEEIDYIDSIKHHQELKSFVVLRGNVKHGDERGGRFSSRPGAWLRSVGGVRGVFMFSEHGCQQRAKHVPTAANFFSCEDSR